MLEVHPMHLAAKGDVDALVHQPVAMQPRSTADLVEQVDRALLENAGTDTAHHVLGAAALDDDIVDAGFGEQGAKQKPGRSGADDGDLCSHQSRPIRMTCPSNARAVRRLAPVAITICGRISHSSVHAAPERSCSCTRASCMPPVRVAL